MKAIEAIEAVIENYEMNGAHPNTFESAHDVFEIYDIKFDEYDFFLVQAFLNFCKKFDKIDSLKDAKSIIHKVVDMYDFGVIFNR